MEEYWVTTMGRLKKADKAELEQKVWDLLVTKHLTEYQIARRLGVTQRVVRTIIDDVSERYADEIRKKAKMYVAQQVDRYMWAMQESQQAWERSKLNTGMKKIKTEPAIDKEGNPYDRVTTEERISVNPAGDPRHFENFLKSAAAFERVVKMDELVEGPIEPQAPLTDEQRARRLLKALPSIQVLAQYVQDKETPQLTDNQYVEGDFVVDGELEE